MRGHFERQNCCDNIRRTTLRGKVSFRCRILAFSEGCSHQIKNWLRISILDVLTGSIPCQLKRSFNFLHRLIEIRSKLKIKVEHMGFDLGYSDRSRFIVLLFLFFVKQALAMDVCKGRSSGVDPPVSSGLMLPLAGDCLRASI